MTDTLSGPSGMLGRAGALVVWFGGSLASITAVFHATGYLIAGAHLSMLGLYGVVAFNDDQLVQEVGRFFLVAGYALVTKLALPLLAVFGPLVIVAMLVKRWAAWLLQRLWGRRHDGLPVFGFRPWMRLLAFIALFAGFIMHAEIYLPKFREPLCISNLLYADAGGAPCDAVLMSGADRLKVALIARDELLLNRAFEDLVSGFALALVLVWITWRTTLPWRWRACCVAPSAFAALVYLIMLPVAYAVLQRPIIYPRATLTFNGESSPPMSGAVFLLNQTANEFVVWDASVQKLSWIPSGSVRRIVIDGNYALFEAPARDHKVEGR